MTRPARSLRRASLAVALAVFFGVLVLMSLVMDGGEKTAVPAIGGRRMLTEADGGQTTLEDFKADDPFHDSKRRVPNGPDPIHNSFENVSFLCMSEQKLPYSWPCIGFLKFGAVGYEMLLAGGLASREDLRVERSGTHPKAWKVPISRRHICGANRWSDGALQEGTNKNNIMIGSGWMLV
ncbi:hypothetical protein GUJ93_ZPchr0003g16663 [Zizania palustris]|uniref:Uncharacterized protein n=1 Tax=Zizania palustris TaxID=103762 RepID=A0A8J5SJD5_ZIZPA|nr:hypothetical protein GUJ93_ZPchr0003g16663 [Zizania palustris]